MTEEAATESGDDPDLDPDLSPDLSQQFTFDSWTGPKFVFKKVHQWAVKDWGKSSRSSIGWFLQYCWAFCESEEEEDEMFVWMLSLIGLYVKEDGWGGFCQGALKWDWSQVAVRDGWEIPAPEWARLREEEDIRNGLVETVVVVGDGQEGGGKGGDREKDDGKRGGGKSCEREEGDGVESEVKEDEMCVEQDGKCVKNVDEKCVEEDGKCMEEDKKCVEEEDVKGRCEEECGEGRDKSVEFDEGPVMKEAGEAAFPGSLWGSQLPPPTPPNPKPLLDWRPWEVAKPRKWKKRSPASQARSLRRLREWQKQRDQFTSTRESPSTPLPLPRALVNVRLVDRLENEVGEKFGSQTSPLSQRSGSQIPLVPTSWSGSQTVPYPPSWSGSQTASCSPPWSQSQTASCSPPLVW